MVFLGMFVGYKFNDGCGGHNIIIMFCFARSKLYEVNLNKNERLTPHSHLGVVIGHTVSRWLELGRSRLA